MQSPEEFFTDKTNILCMSIGAVGMALLCCIYKCFCK